MPFRPAYTYLSRREIEARIERALVSLGDCRICPRDCGVNRLEDRWAACKTGRYAVVGSWFPHFGEEDCLRGWNGSGTIFFSHCNLRCRFCFHPDTLVATDAGLLRIAEIFERAEGTDDPRIRRTALGPRVVTRQGRWALVSKVFRHDFDGELVRLKPYNCPPLLLTPNHRVFATTKGDPGGIVEVAAGELRSEHRLLVPVREPLAEEVVVEVHEIVRSRVRYFLKAVPRRASRLELVAAFEDGWTSHDLSSGLFEREVENDLVEKDGRIKFKTEKRPGIPSRLNLDDRLAWLLGFFCAEGHVSSLRDRPNSHHLVFSFSHQEADRAIRVQRIIRELFGVDTSLRHRRTTITVESNKASLALLFAGLCGRGARTKQVPSLLLRAGRAELESFLRGVMEGDGCDRGSHDVVNTVSRDFALGLFQIGLLLGRLPSFHEWRSEPTTVIEGRRVNQATLYYVKFPKTDPETGRIHSRWTPKNGAFQVPIHRAERIQYEGPVYNLEVDDPDHSYLSPFVAVANCQNWEISWGIKPKESPPGHRPEAIAAMMLELQARGCHNINFVTPEHVVPQVVEALAVAIRDGLRLPIVYNTSAYDSLESIALMEGLVDIYMPDFKFWSPERARVYMQAEDYPAAARAAIGAMLEQVGPLVVGADGLARRGLLVRHLVMPGMLDETRAILEWVAAELGPDSYVNLMDQYYPSGKVGPDTLSEINRRLDPEEFRQAQAIARELGLRRLDERRPHPSLARWLA